MIFLFNQEIIIAWTSATVPVLQNTLSLEIEQINFLPFFELKRNLKAAEICHVHSLQIFCYTPLSFLKYPQ